VDLISRSVRTFSSGAGRRAPAPCPDQGSETVPGVFRNAERVCSVRLVRTEHTQAEGSGQPDSRITP
jgi:hypothetical protein